MLHRLHNYSLLATCTKDPEECILQLQKYLKTYAFSPVTCISLASFPGSSAKLFFAHSKISEKKKAGQKSLGMRLVYLHNTFSYLRTEARDEAKV